MWELDAQPSLLSVQFSPYIVTGLAPTIRLGQTLYTTPYDCAKTGHNKMCTLSMQTLYTTPYDCAKPGLNSMCTIFMQISFETAYLDSHKPWAIAKCIEVSLRHDVDLFSCTQVTQHFLMFAIYDTFELTLVKLYKKIFSIYTKNILQHYVLQKLLAKKTYSEKSFRTKLHKLGCSQLDAFS